MTILINNTFHISKKKDNFMYEIFQNTVKKSKSKTVLILFCIKDSQPAFRSLLSLYRIPPLKCYKAIYFPI